MSGHQTGPRHPPTQSGLSRALRNNPPPSMQQRRPSVGQGTPLDTLPLTQNAALAAPINGNPPGSLPTNFLQGFAGGSLSSSQPSQMYFHARTHSGGNTGSLNPNRAMNGNRNGNLSGMGLMGSMTGGSMAGSNSSVSMGAHSSARRNSLAAPYSRPYQNLLPAVPVFSTSVPSSSVLSSCLPDRERRPSSAASASSTISASSPAFPTAQLTSKPSTELAIDLAVAKEHNEQLVQDLQRCQANLVEHIKVNEGLRTQVQLATNRAQQQQQRILELQEERMQQGNAFGQLKQYSDQQDTQQREIQKELQILRDVLMKNSQLKEQVTTLEVELAEARGKQERLELKDTQDASFAKTQTQELNSENARVTAELEQEKAAHEECRAALQKIQSMLAKTTTQFQKAQQTHKESLEVMSVKNATLAHAVAKAAENAESVDQEVLIQALEQQALEHDDTLTKLKSQHALEIVRASTIVHDGADEEDESKRAREVQGLRNILNEQVAAYQRLQQSEQRSQEDALALRNMVKRLKLERAALISDRDRAQCELTSARADRGRVMVRVQHLEDLVSSQEVVFVPSPAEPTQPFRREVVRHRDLPNRKGCVVATHVTQESEESEEDLVVVQGNTLVQQGRERHHPQQQQKVQQEEIAEPQTHQSQASAEEPPTSVNLPSSQHNHPQPVTECRGFGYGRDYLASLFAPSEQAAETNPRDKEHDPSHFSDVSADQQQRDVLSDLLNTPDQSISPGLLFTGTDSSQRVLMPPASRKGTSAVDQGNRVPTASSSGASKGARNSAKNKRETKRHVRASPTSQSSQSVSPGTSSDICSGTPSDTLFDIASPTSSLSMSSSKSTASPLTTSLSDVPSPSVIVSPLPRPVSPMPTVPPIPTRPQVSKLQRMRDLLARTQTNGDSDKKRLSQPNKSNKSRSAIPAAQACRETSPRSLSPTGSVSSPGRRRGKPASKISKSKLVRIKGKPSPDKHTQHSPDPRAKQPKSKLVPPSAVTAGIRPPGSKLLPPSSKLAGRSKRKPKTKLASGAQSPQQKKQPSLASPKTGRGSGIPKPS